MVYIGTPKHLMDFLKFYAREPKGYRYYCVSAGSSVNDPLVTACIRSGVFKKVYFFPSLFKMPFFRLLSLNLSLLFSCISRTKEYLAKKFLSGVFHIPCGGRFICPCNYGLIPGLMVSLSRTKECVQLEDGLTEYADKDPSFNINYLRSPLLFYYFFLARAGFADLTYRMGTEGDRWCIKYVSFPDLMKYRNYKEIRQLPVPEGEEKDLYFGLLQKCFLLENLPEDTGLIILTAPFDDFALDQEAIIQRISSHITQLFPGRKALLKRHPRDGFKKYEFPGLNVTEVDSYIPGELLIQHFPKVPVVSFNMSTALLEAAAHGNPMTVYKIQDLTSGGRNNRQYEDIFEKGLKMMTLTFGMKPDVLEI